MATEITPDRSGHVEVEGRSIWWEYHGDGSREAMCLLNGLAMHTRAWYHFLPLLTDELDVLLYDFPGQGLSSSEDEPVTIPHMADCLRAILDQLGIGRIHVMGISYGGFIALEFARLHQERLHTLTLSGILATRERLFDMYQDLSLRFYRGGREAFELYTHYMYEKIFGERFVSTVPPEQLEAMRQRFFDRYAEETHALIRLTEAQDPFFAALDESTAGYRAVATPTLIMAGAQDRAIPPWVQEKLVDILPNSRYEVIPDCGHVVYLEAPEHFFGRVKRFAATRALEP